MSMEETVAYNTRGRPLLFTPERMEQIKNLVERGHTREQIAEIVGCTAGTLSVTCSRLGISLRRPKPLDNGVRMRLNGNRGDGDGAQRPPQQQQQPETDQPPPDGPQIITVSIRLEYRDYVRETPIPLSAETLAYLILEAEMRDLRLIELIAQIIMTCVDKKDFP